MIEGDYLTHYTPIVGKNENQKIETSQQARDFEIWLIPTVKSG